MKKYDASSIEVYKGLSAVRKRPEMYIGNTQDGSALHRMIFEVVDNSIDENLSGFCDVIEICLHKNNTISVFDNGRGMPTDFHNNEKKSAAEVIMTVLHAGAKFSEKSYRLSSGLHGVGVSVVNALSKNLKLQIFRSGLIYEQNYLYGKPLDQLKIVGHTDKRGTNIDFIPDSIIFGANDIKYEFLLSRLKELSFLNPNVILKLIDNRAALKSIISFQNKGGIKAFVSSINEKKTIINKDILYFSGKSNNISVNVAMQWINSYKEDILCYTNNVYQKDGGSHLIGFKSAITRVFKTYIDEYFTKARNKPLIQGEDIREGLVSVLSIYMNNPKFSSQVKEKLVSAEARQAVESILSDKLKDFLYENPSISKLILNKIIIASKARDAARKARDISRKKYTFDTKNFCSKLSDCQEKRPDHSELFLVEGDSAGGSAKQARDRKTQAVLPLKGKILNVEKVTFDKILSNPELISIINVLKCGIGINSFDENKLRYHKIIFMTDADVDGSHIRTLLMTFFYRHTPKLIENGYIFISKPPLYRLQKGKEVFYIENKASFNEFLNSQIINELYNDNQFDKSLLKDILILYDNICSFIDTSLKKYPKNFFKKMCVFKNYFTNETNINIYSSYLLFLNKTSNNEHIFSFNDDIIFNNSFNFFFFKHGVSKKYKLNLKFFESPEYDLIKNLNKKLLNFYNNKNLIIYNNEEYHLNQFDDLIEILRKQITSKYTIQRYKGLGEMSAQQLWDTTMNPKSRILYQLSINDVNQANSIFSNLMGDNIIERKRMIENHTYSLSDLDF